MKIQYKPLNYMLRMPLHSTNFCNKYNDMSMSIDEIKNDNFFNEQLLIASPTLYQMIQNVDYINLKDKKKRNIMSSLLSYQNRASFRTTPFGLFTGIELKNISSEEQLELDKFIHKKHCRVDIEWLIDFVKYIETYNYSILNYKLNSALYKIGDRAYLLYNTGDYAGETGINYSSPFKIIDKLCSNSFSSFDEILNKLREFYPDRTDDTLEKYLKTLIEKEYLISELRPPVCNTNEFNYVINIVRSYDKLSSLYLDSLLEIKKLLSKYVQTNIGNGIHLYNEISNRMRNIHDNKKNNFIQVDCELETDINLVTDGDICAINNFINYIFKVSAISNIENPLEEYALRFEEKYGEYIEVPIFILLNESLGIGAPKGYKKPNNKFSEYNNIQRNEERLQVYFMEKYSQAIRSNNPILLSDEEIKKYEDNINFNSFCNSLELNFIIKYKDNEKLFYLGPNVGSNMAGKTFGRFCYISNEYNCLINNIHNELKKQDNFELCELSFIPPQIKSGNVTRNISFLGNNMSLFTNSYDINNEIKLENILVGYSNGHFYLRDSVSNKKIRVYCSNMLNPAIMSNIIRFMLDISLNQDITLKTFPWDKYYEDLAYIPEIRYKNIIISNERWRITDNLVQNIDSSNFQEFCHRFSQLKESLRIPDLIYYTVSDNRLLLNLNESKNIKLIYEYFKKGSYIELEKAEAGNNAVKKNNNEYTSEVVIPFVKKDIYNDEPNISKIKSMQTLGILPFEDWLYIKLYGPIQRQRDLLIYLNHFIKEINSEFKYDKFFFMRYADPKPHLRLRFKGDKNTLFHISIKLNNFIQLLQQKYIIDTINIDTYIKETQRYGGEELIDFAETVFYEDSKVVLEIYENFNIIENRDKYGVATILNYLDAFKLTFEQQLEFLINSTNQEYFLEDFKKVKKEFVNNCDSYNNWINFKKDTNCSLFLETINRKNDAISNYIKQLENSNNITNESHNIIGSFIHLHFNRLFGIDRNYEDKIMNYASRTLYGQRYLRKQLMKNGAKKL